MLDKESFKEGLQALFNAHQMMDKASLESNIEWYEECKDLELEDFKKAISRCKYTQYQPKLRDILINLPGYTEKHTTINEYAEWKRNKPKVKRYDMDALVKRLDAQNRLKE